MSINYLQCAFVQTNGTTSWQSSRNFQMRPANRKRTQNPTSIITLLNPDRNFSSHLTFRVSGDPVSNASGQAGVGTALNLKVQHSLTASQSTVMYVQFDWTGLYVSVAVDWTVVVRSSYLFHVTTKCWSLEAKDGSHQDLSRTLWSLLLVLTSNTGT